VTVAIVAIGGYGAEYVSALLEPKQRKVARIVAAVDPRPELCPQLDELKKAKVPIYPSLVAFYKDIGCAPSSASRRGAGRFGGQVPDLVIISSPIHMHASQTILALEHGSNVLCEKPMCATVQEADAVRSARDRAGRFVIIGYQGSFSPVTQALKRDILRGIFGKPKRLACLCLNGRDAGYYGRNRWAGALKANRRWVLDSPANNANAHFLHAMFYLLGRRLDTSAVPAKVTAELYRANDITNCDTAALRCRTTAGVEVLFFTSHAVDVGAGPVFRYEFDKAVITPGAHGEILARMKGGRTKVYRGAESPGVMGKLGKALRLAGLHRGSRAHTVGQAFLPVHASLVGTDKNVCPTIVVTCGIEAARSQTLCINGAQDSSRPVVAFPRRLIRAAGDGPKRLTFLPGLAGVLRECFKKNKLPSELGAPWAKPGKPIDLTNYRRFPGGT
jgi:predicted dehydrogenase